MAFYDKVYRGVKKTVNKGLNEAGKQIKKSNKTINKAKLDVILKSGKKTFNAVESQIEKNADFVAKTSKPILKQSIKGVDQIVSPVLKAPQSALNAFKGVGRGAEQLLGGAGGFLKGGADLFKYVPLILLIGGGVYVLQYLPKQKNKE